MIETIEAIPDLDESAPTEARRKEIDRLAVKRDREIRDEGIYILISKHDRVMSHVLIRERYADVLPIEKRDAIQTAFLKEFKNHDYDGGLLSGVKAIEQALEGVSARGAVAHVGGAHAPVPNRGGGKAAGHSMIGTFLLILAGIFGVLLILKLVGGLFGRSAGAGYPGQAGMGMPRPMGGGPGYYGGPGYGGGGGGGFFSGLLGGLGGLSPATGSMISSPDATAETFTPPTLSHRPTTRPDRPTREATPSSEPATTPVEVHPGMTAAEAPMSVVVIGAVAEVTGAVAAATWAVGVVIGAAAAVAIGKIHAPVK